MSNCGPKKPFSSLQIVSNITFPFNFIDNSLKKNDTIAFKSVVKFVLKLNNNQPSDSPYLSDCHNLSATRTSSDRYFIDMDRLYQVKLLKGYLLKVL